MTREKQRAQSRCDWCWKTIPCEAGGIAERNYWTLPSWGLIACDACLVANADDFADLSAPRRLWALRLRLCHGVNVDSIQATAKAAEREIVMHQANAPLDALAESFELFTEGERLAAMYAARAAWNAADALHLAMSKTMRAGRGNSKGGRKGADASRNTRRGPHSKRAGILAERIAYRGKDSAQIATIARKTGATVQYVRRVLKETGN